MFANIHVRVSTLVLDSSDAEMSEHCKLVERKQVGFVDSSSFKMTQGLTSLLQNLRSGPNRGMWWVEGRSVFGAKSGSPRPITYAVSLSNI
jgi:hypothetical protein